MALPIAPAWAQIIDDYADYMKVADRRPNTIRARREQLNHLARRMDVAPDEVTPPILMRYAASQDWQTETRRSRYAGIREFFKWAKREGWTEQNPAKRLPRVKASEPNPDPVPEHVYDEAHRQARLRGDHRLEIMLRLAYEHGLRRAEIAVGSSADLREDLLGWSLLVHGKGGKLRIVPLTPRMALELRALGSGWFFEGAINGHLSERRVGEILRDAIDGHWTGHKLRHSFATNVHEASGGDIQLTGDLLGHVNVAVTPRYIKLREERRRAAVYLANGYEAPAVPTRRLRAV